MEPVFIRERFDEGAGVSDCLSSFAQAAIDALQFVAEKIVAFCQVVFQVIEDFFVAAYEYLFYEIGDVPEVFDPLYDIPPAIHGTVQVNNVFLGRVPEPFDPTNIQHIAREANPPIVIEEVLTLFDQSFSDKGNNDIILNDQGRHVTKLRARGLIERSYLDYINYPEASSYHQQVAESMKIYLQGIIFELRKPNEKNSDEPYCPIEKKREAFINLANSAGHCPPRRHEEVKKVYLRLSNQMETVENIILGYVQEAKEDLFREYYSLSREPVQTLNYIRREVGLEFGLDKHAINLADIYIDLHDARSPENRDSKHRTKAQFQETFRRIFTPANAMKVTLHTINKRMATDAEFTAQLSQFIDNEVRAHFGEESQEVESLPNPYQYDYDVEGKAYHLTPEGIRFLLCHFGILTPNEENGHFVRAPDPEPVAVLVDE